MQIRPVPAIATLVSLTALSGCPVPQTREFTAHDSGRTVTLPAAADFTVRLESNATTGYQWQLDALDQAVVLNTSHDYIGPAVPMPGAGGTEEWNFVTQAVGTTTLQMSYRRPWEPDAPPASTFELTVTVAAGL